MGVDPKEVAYLQAASKAFGGYKQPLVSKAPKELKIA